MEDPIFGPVSKAELQKPGFNRLSISELVALRRPWWIGPSGEVIDLAIRNQDHALSAIDITKVPNPVQAIEEMVSRGFIRVQTYPDSTAFVQGTYDALVDHGDRILEIVPDLKSVEIAYIPADYQAPPSVTRAEIDLLGWGETMERARGWGRMGKRARR